jgi:hypothetical protein
MSENRRIIGATPYRAFDGTWMRSKLETRIYKWLYDLGFSPQYESETFITWVGPRPTVPFYDLSKTRHNQLNMKKLIDIRYTPDFIMMYKGIKVIIEAKGIENDQFPIRKKLFRAFLETVDYPVIYAEIYTKRQLNEFINELKDKYETTE